DIIYSCQDFAFDRREGLFSIPRSLGIPAALQVARAMHVSMVLCLFWLVQLFELGWLSVAGTGAAAALLVWEHSLVRPGDLSRVNAAFFTANGWVSVLFCLFWTADILFVRSVI
ncbi:MAG TPA: UbiA family prenyltransferase, partial [Bryobacteraceae bacterium]|nr:UbiA family prenyltransferase [Bryobacteraceae bacterium]